MISVLGAEKLSLVEVEAFLAASESVRFAGCDRAEIYRWVERLLRHHKYPLQKRRVKGLLRAYVEHMTGLSQAQSTRLIARYLKAGRIAPKPSARPRFQRRYTPADVELLASVDQVHERLSSAATRHILKREFEVYGKAEFGPLAQFSNGHLYNLRRSPHYSLRNYEKTCPAASGLVSAASPRPTLNPAFCASIQYIKETARRATSSTASTPSMRLRSGGGAGYTAYRRGLADALAGEDPPAFPLSDPQLSLRQRLGVYQQNRCSQLSLWSQLKARKTSSEEP
jgi:hypothetical protein